MARLDELLASRMSTARASSITLAGDLTQNGDFPCSERQPLGQVPCWRAIPASRTSTARASSITRRCTRCLAKHRAVPNVNRSGKFQVPSPSSGPQGPERQPLGQVPSQAATRFMSIAPCCPERQPLGQVPSRGVYATRSDLHTCPERQPLGQVPSRSCDEWRRGP